MTPLALALGGCQAAVDAPDDVEAQAVYAFVNFEVEGAVEAVLDGLLSFVRDPPPELSEGYLVDSLTADDLAGVGVRAADLDGVVGALGSATYTVPPARVAEGTTAADRASWWEGVNAFTVVAERGERDCFVEQSCDRFTQWLRDETQVPVLGTAARSFRNELRWVTSASGEVALVVRQLAPQPVELSTTLLAIDQQYALAVVGAQGDGAVRAEAIWVDARVLGAELSEGFAVRQAVGQMQAAADQISEAFGP